MNTSWSEQIGNELYVYIKGKLAYKKWFKKNSLDKQNSVIINDNGFPNEWIK